MVAAQTQYDMEVFGGLSRNCSGVHDMDVEGFSGGGKDCSSKLETGR